MRFLILMFLFVNLSFSQITSSTISGKILIDDKPAVKYKVTLIFLPTNSIYDTETDKHGRFSLDNLEVGGPFRIIIKYNNNYYIKNNIYLSLGDNDITDIKIYNKN